MEKVAMKDELERGHGFAKQLGRLILKYSDGGEEDDDDDSSKTTSYAEDLAAKVVDSFTKTILLFNNIQHSHRVSADSACDSPANNSDERRHESSDKSKSTTMINKYERTCSSQKRKSTRTRTWEEDSKISPKKDEYAWRKYGQKNILNAKYPRNYFRCSYKYEKGCQATKQVQRIQEDPPLFKTTYFGHHTCSNPHMCDNYNDLSTSSIMISFNNTHNNNTAFDLQKNNTINFLSSMTFPSSIEENKNKNNNNNDDHDDDNNNNNNNDIPSSSWNNDWLLSPNEVLPFESGDLVDFVNSSAVFHDPGYDPFEIRHNNNNNTNNNNNDNDNNVPSSSWNDDRLLSPDEVLVAFESDDLVDANSSAVFHDPMSDPFETSSLL